MSALSLQTELGSILLRLRRDSAPVTCDYIVKCVADGLYDGTTFYRSDFVIQCGLHGTSKVNPYGNIPVNETSTGTVVSNTRGTAAIAHWDVPDCGNTEFFINLQPNAHLDTAYGGYCVFAEVDTESAESFDTVDKIAAAIPAGKVPKILAVTVVP